jgi:hypothetical protein
MMHKCDNCGATFSEEELKQEIKDIHQRVDPGELMPSGECTSCGALVHPIDATTRLTPELTNDLYGLCSYILEHEYEDMIGSLSDYNDCGLSDEELESLHDYQDELVQRVCNHPENRHVYALAYRLISAIRPVEELLG